MKSRVCLIISGKVQGVFYRHSARETAISMNICGTAKNLANGDVEIIAQGDISNLNQFISWCKVGPEYATVDSVKVEWQKYLNECKIFDIQ